MPILEKGMDISGGLKWRSEFYSSKGNFMTPKFRLDFDEDTFEKSLSLEIVLKNKFYSPDEIVERGYYHLKVYPDLHNLDFVECLLIRPSQDGCVGNKIHYLEYNISATEGEVYLSFNRTFEAAVYKRWKKKRNTGFRIDWKYHPTNDEHKVYQSAACEHVECQLFKTFANLLHEREVSSQKIWTMLEKIMAKWVLDEIEVDLPYNERDLDSYRLGLLKMVQNRLDIERKANSSTLYKVPKNKLEIAGQMMSYLLAEKKNIKGPSLNSIDDSSAWQTLFESYQDTIGESSSLSNLLQIVAGLLNEENNDLVNFALEDLARMFHLEFINISNHIFTESHGNI